MASDDAIARLARQIEGDARTHRPSLLQLEDVTRMRRGGAAELHSICAEFVASVNNQLSSRALELAPAEYTPDSFHDAGTNLIQISSRGRLVQIAFGATRELSSTEKHVIPYILEGEVRTYNQEMLERFDVHSLGLFYCVEEKQNVWRYSDWLRNRNGAFGRTLLVDLMGNLF